MNTTKKHDWMGRVNRVMMKVYCVFFRAEKVFLHFYVKKYFCIKISSNLAA